MIFQILLKIMIKIALMNFFEVGHLLLVGCMYIRPCFRSYVEGHSTKETSWIIFIINIIVKTSGGSRLLILGVRILC